VSARPTQSRRAKASRNERQPDIHQTPPAQIIPFLGLDRRCVVCGVFVGNLNLGGHDGHALTGKLWCLQCADRRSSP
jgi:hypothetical protein